jgi:hypothetical protein
MGKPHHLSSSLHRALGYRPEIPANSQTAPRAETKTAVPAGLPHANKEGRVQIAEPHGEACGPALLPGPMADHPDPPLGGPVPQTPSVRPGWRRRADLGTPYPPGWDCLPPPAWPHRPRPSSPLSRATPAPSPLRGVVSRNGPRLRAAGIRVRQSRGNRGAGALPRTPPVARGLAEPLRRAPGARLELRCPLCPDTVPPHCPLCGPVKTA